MLRELNGLTQDEMAEKLKMTTKGYTRIEHDLGNPNLPKIEKIAKIFDYDCAGIFGFLRKWRKFLHFQQQQPNQRQQWAELLSFWKTRK